MANKKHKLDFRNMSDRVCRAPGCTKHIKQRIVDLRPDADLCFAHHMELVRNNPRYRNGKDTGRHVVEEVTK